MSPRYQALSTYEKECIALLMAIEKWRSYLQHQKFRIFTDHISLLHLTEQRVTSKLQHKALMKLMDLTSPYITRKAQQIQLQIHCPDVFSDNSVQAVFECPILAQ